MPQYFNIILLLFEQIHRILNHFIFDGYHHIVDIVKIPIALCMSLYLFSLGYSIVQGWIEYSFKYLVHTAFRLSAIYMLSMNWDIFSHYFVDFIQKGSSEIGAYLLHSTQLSMSVDFTKGLEGALQSVLIQFTKVGYWLWRRGSWHEFGPLFEAITVWSSGMILVIYGIIQLIVANFMLSVLFVVAPIFFAMLVFDVTKNLFEKWLGQIISYAMLILFISVMLSVVLSVASWSISDINANNLLQTSSMVTFIPITIVCIVCVALLRRTSNMAHAIGDHFSIHSIKRGGNEKNK